MSKPEDRGGPPGPAFAPKWVLSGFPKSGLHLLTSYLLPMARPQHDVGGLVEYDWAGTFYDRSWGTHWMPPEQSCYKLGRVQDQHFLRAHLGYQEEVDRFLYLLGAAHVFVYRDLRDVAVSQAHHILDDDEAKFPHPGKAAYRQLGGFEEVLRAVIEGYDNYPGVLERWKLYEPWLRVDWVLKRRYEELIGTDREAQAARIVRYGLERIAGVWGMTVQVNMEGLKPLVQSMAESSLNTSRSPTFRQGTAGAWRDEFTPELCDLFRRLDTDHALGSAGYGW